LWFWNCFFVWPTTIAHPTWTSFDENIVIRLYNVVHVWRGQILVNMGALSIESVFWEFFCCAWVHLVVFLGGWVCLLVSTFPNCDDK
jgi:hypothetical protein